MFSLTTRGQLDPETQLEFERFYAVLSEFLRVSFNEDGTLITPAPTGVVPIGAIISWGSMTDPPGWIELDGSLRNRVVYKSLFELWGTTYGAGDGSTTFQIIDSRQRFVLGLAAAGTGAVLGEVGGNIDHTHSFSGVSISGTTSANGGHSHTGSGTTSSDGAHTHSQGAHQHAIIGVATAAAGADVTVRNSSTNIDIFADSGTGSAGTHSHTVSINIDATGDHTHTFSGSASGSVGTANPPYIALRQMVYTGVVE